MSEKKETLMLKKLIITMTLLLCATSVSFAHTRRGDHGARAEHHQRRAAMRRLHLTEAQRSELRAIRERHRHELAPMREKMRARRAELRRLNEARSEELRKEMRIMRQELRTHRQAMRAEMLRVLTPEQRQMLKKRR
jgi:Spy/CpxP family protein refolding chaperone